MLSWGVFEGSADAGSLWAEVRPAGNVDGDRHKLQGPLPVGHSLDPDLRVSYRGPGCSGGFHFQCYCLRRCRGVNKAGAGAGRAEKEGGAMVGQQHCHNDYGRHLPRL
jgi:hypothetical protein